jgi:NAD(P)H-hydrate epimerase
MKALDRRTIDELGVPGAVLMECAAWACVEEILERWSDRLAAGVAIACGPGNNGGDGLAIARRLHILGIPTEVVLLGPGDALTGDAALQARLLTAMGVRVLEAANLQPLSFAARRWPERGVVVDAIFGTGLTREVTGVHAAAVEAIATARAAGAKVLSVDIPSGIHGTTGQIMGTAVTADVCVTFAAMQTGHFTAPGRARRGMLVVADIGIPVDLAHIDPTQVVSLLSPEVLRRAVPPGPLAAHKGTFGHALVVAGGPGKYGAAKLCAEAVLRAGAGLVTLAVPESVGRDELAGLAHEVMITRVPGGSSGRFGAGSAPRLLEALEGKTALAVGPGLGTHPDTIHVARRLYKEARVPAVFDADGLNALALGGVPSGRPAGPRVLTPHPGEAGRLASTPTAAVQSSRLQIARAIARRMSAVVALKGSSTVVADPSGEAGVNPTGNPGMATAGTGDVLTGVVAGLLARGCSAEMATRAAVVWHGMAGDLAAERIGLPSITAGDVLAHLGMAWRMSGERRFLPRCAFRPDRRA